MSGFTRCLLVSPEIYYIHADHLGTPRKITRPNDNQVVWSWESEAFGNSLPDQNPADLGTFVFNLRFPGQYYDQETGLFYNYFRDYDPATGRYIESDPIGLAGGVNTYDYVNANPISYMDSEGLSPKTDAIKWLFKKVRDGCKWISKRTKDDGGSSKDTITRKTPGADGGQSSQIIECDAYGNVISRTHTVTTKEEIVHQHQNQVGKNGAIRQFPDEWTETETINVPYENIPPKFPADKVPGRRY